MCSSQIPLDLFSCLFGLVNTSSIKGNILTMQALLAAIYYVATLFYHRLYFQHHFVLTNGWFEHFSLSASPLQCSLHWKSIQIIPNCTPLVLENDDVPPNTSPFIQTSLAFRLPTPSLDLPSGMIHFEVPSNLASFSAPTSSLRQSTDLLTPATIAPSSFKSHPYRITIYSPTSLFNHNSPTSLFCPTSFSFTCHEKSATAPSQQGLALAPQQEVLFVDSSASIPTVQHTINKNQIITPYQQPETWNLRLLPHFSVSPHQSHPNILPAQLPVNSQLNLNHEHHLLLSSSTPPPNVMRSPTIPTPLLWILSIACIFLGLMFATHASLS